VGSKALNFGIKYVSQSTKMPATMSKLKPFIEKILYEVLIVPIMMITHRDVSMFSEDPIEYVRKQNDFTETLYQPKNTAVDLLSYLCQYKSSKKAKQPDYLKPFLMFCGKHLEHYKHSLATPGSPQVDWRVKEAILNAIGGLIETIDAYKDLKGMMEGVMSGHVLHELDNPQPFMRMRALTIYGIYTEQMKFKDNEHLKEVVLRAFRCLVTDPDLPVRLTASTSVSKLLRNDVASELLKPHLRQILESYLKLMTEIESEELVNALEEIVSLYKDDIDPFAVQLTEQLVGSFQRLV
jgi:importin-7